MINKGNTLKKIYGNKGKCLVVLSATLFITSSVRAASDETKISVSGKIIANTCVLDKTLSDLSPTLDTISQRDIQGKGTIAGKKEIKIVLNNCGADTSSVTVKASGSVDANDSAAFINTSTDNAAKNIGLYFYQTDAITKFKPDGSVSQNKIELKANGNNTLNFTAAYVATAGNFTSLVGLSIEYN